MKLRRIIFISVACNLFLGLFLFFNANVAKAADSTCETSCVAPTVCINGSCMMPAHNVTPSNNKIPGDTTEGSQIIKCGRPGQNMCTLCDLIAGMNNIIQYLMKIAIGVALLAITIGGVMYVVSAGDTGLADMAKKTITNAAVGFVIIFAAFLIIDTTISYLGTKEGMGINVTSWGQFECAPGIH
ncbi:MAG: hypothetical protein ACD_9C00296G0002 [uncultured bacterium]|nr:MAG: hypothetical protein ACD_9C00296G0002 [uncultured bacterium]